VERPKTPAPMIRILVGGIVLVDIVFMWRVDGGKGRHHIEVNWVLRCIAMTKMMMRIQYNNVRVRPFACPHTEITVVVESRNGTDLFRFNCVWLGC